MGGHYLHCHLRRHLRRHDVAYYVHGGIAFVVTFTIIINQLVMQTIDLDQIQATLSSIQSMLEEQQSQSYQLDWDSFIYQESKNFLSTYYPATAGEVAKEIVSVLKECRSSNKYYSFVAMHFLLGSSNSIEISNFLQLVSISDRLAHFTKNRVKMYDLRKKLQGIQSPLTAKFCTQLSQETGCSF